ncbi:hypothetical protein NFHSH190041_30740 [Shewanella sp. NFH-SH190041]|uniref:prepilin-type N-terminal cleavage/methylation domain-containing protein n=1 Tax=Shewanella sp. NFH-SH190041 TaxID=2950245 RepID=UPI0021F9AF90|nr:prepilin-type N-terminal cleavage/methylation domain-containing protein [Shewanella sp. NFH-SH190041]BDM65622.1 hypothetical protein NFHSH190041_30740 [Shewanella sp. NFH-SH190041]
MNIVRHKMKKNRGFTLIELVVVIIILGILAVTAVPKFLNFKEDAIAATYSGYMAALKDGMKLAKSRWYLDGKQSPVEINGVQMYFTSKGVPKAVGTNTTGDTTNAANCAAIWNAVVKSSQRMKLYGTAGCVENGFTQCDMYSIGADQVDGGPNAACRFRVVKEDGSVARIEDIVYRISDGIVRCHNSASNTPCFQ